MKFVSKKRKYLGTIIEIKIPQKCSSFFSFCFDELKRIEQTYSRFISTSQLSQVNSQLHTWQKIDSEFFYIIEKALEFQKKTNGNFDITLKTTLEQLGYDTSYSFSPKTVLPQSLIQKIISHIQKPILINKNKSSVYLRKQIDFGGLGKGFALDVLANLLKQKGVTDFYINAGGDIFCSTSVGNKPWTILLEHPDDVTRAIGKVELANGAITCSAPNRRKWKSYHHLLNAKTKLPQNDVKCIFVLAKTGIEADAYATGVFTAGFSEGIQISQKLPIEVFLVSSKNKVYQTKNFPIHTL